MKESIKFKFGRNVKIERIRKNITQEKFAEMIDMSLSYISKLEQGLTSPTAIAFIKYWNAIRKDKSTNFLS